MRANDVEVCVEFIFTTEKAMKVKDCDNEIWLPHSQIHNLKDPKDLKRGDNIILEIPEWLAQDKELI